MRQRRPHRWIAALFLVLIASALIFEIEVTFVAYAPAATPATAPVTPAMATQPTTRPNAFAPLTYFETSCATCHGPYGSDYGEEFGKHLTDAQLTTAIDNMAHGPGNAPVGPPELKVLFDYHKAMIGRTPFLIVTRIEGTDGQARLTGEVTPESTVAVDGQRATVDGHSWTITVPTAPAYDVTAQLRDRSNAIRVAP